MESKKTTWVVGSVLLGVVIAALAWFVLIAPVLQESSTVAADTQTALDRNQTLSDQLDRLAEQATQLEAYRAEKATLEAQIPTTGSTSEFLRTLDALAVASPTALVNVEISTPEVVLPAAPTEVPATETTTETTTEEGAAESTDTATSDTAADGTVAAPAAIPGFVAIPVRVTALGNPLGVLNFLGALQEQSNRLMLVTGLEGAGQDEAEASGGRPATADGDLELIISGYIYVLQDSSAAAAAPEETETVPAPPPATGDGTGAFSAT